MKNEIIDNLFELWKYIGHKGGFLNHCNGYKYTWPKHDSWPSKIFELETDQVDLKALSKKIENQLVPQAISILENENLERQLLLNNYSFKSEVKGMYLPLEASHKPDINTNTIEAVDLNSKAVIFAEIASLSFGYEVHPSTISPLINSKKLKLFIGKHNGKYVTCGIIFLDENQISGLHMIGTLPEYRGLGLGQLMTNRLLFEAYENKSKTVVLVASKSGERIYAKLGFIAEGKLRHYSRKA